MIKRLFLFLVVSSLYLSCDKIDNPINNPFLPDAIDTSGFDRVVLIEEFTGVKCNNCPDAALEIKRLSSLYPGKLITMAIHASDFATPSSDFPNDFRTTEGNEIYNDHNPTGFVPGGLMDRRDFSTGLGGLVTLEQSWDTLIPKLVNQFPEVAINPVASYDDALREVSLDIILTALSDSVPQNLYISAFVVEDSIVAPQKMGDNSKNSTYVHNHVLRTSFEGTYGAAISSALPLDQDVTIPTKKVTLDPSWDASHCSVIISVFNRQTQYIYQSAYVKW